MARLNTIMQLVTNTKYDCTFRSIPLADPCTAIGVTSNNNLVLVKYKQNNSFSLRCTIPKREVVQIVAGFSEIA